VFDVDTDGERAAAAGMEVNGFSFDGTDAPGLDYALDRCARQGYSRVTAGRERGLHDRRRG
jgi:hypothetical protein